MIPDRLQRVRITTRGATLVIHWDERCLLLDQLAGLANTGPIIDRFHDAGASSPVHLTDTEADVIAGPVAFLANEHGRDQVPGLAALRDHLTHADVGAP